MSRDSKSKVLKVLSAAAFALALAVPLNANATIHELVAAFCSGGGKGVINDAGFLVAPGVDDPTKKNFAQPVIAVGILSPFPLFSDKKAAKFPEGTNLFTLAVSQSNHPSALHCPKAADLP